MMWVVVVAVVDRMVVVAVVAMGRQCGRLLMWVVHWAIDGAVDVGRCCHGDRRHGHGSGRCGSSLTWQWQCSTWVVDMAVVNLGRRVGMVVVDVVVVDVAVCGGALGRSQPPGLARARAVTQGFNDDRDDGGGKNDVTRRRLNCLARFGNYEINTYLIFII